MLRCCWPADHRSPALRPTLESELARRHGPVRSVFCRQDQAQNTHGSTVIGIRWEGITSGMKVIGLGHRTRGLGGWLLIMMASGSLTVTGTEIAAGLNMTTAGTAAGIVIMTVHGTTTGTTTATSSARSADPPSSAHHSVFVADV